MGGKTSSRCARARHPQRARAYRLPARQGTFRPPPPPRSRLVYPECAVTPGRKVTGFGKSGDGRRVVGYEFTAKAYRELYHNARCRRKETGGRRGFPWVSGESTGVACPTSWARAWADFEATALCQREAPWAAAILGNAWLRRGMRMIGCLRDGVLLYYGAGYGGGARA